MYIFWHKFPFHLFSLCANGFSQKSWKKNLIKSVKVNRLVAPPHLVVGHCWYLGCGACFVKRFMLSFEHVHHFISWSVSQSCKPVVLFLVQPSSCMKFQSRTARIYLTCRKPPAWCVDSQGENVRCYGNIRTLFQAGKLAQVMKEMDNCRLDILGISETHGHTVTGCTLPKGRNSYSTQEGIMTNLH